MSRLSQRTVDYSIKAYELGSPDFCRRVRNSELELRYLQRGIEDQGRALFVAGSHTDSDSHFASCALRICSALHVTYQASAAIARHTMLNLGDRRRPRDRAMKEMGRLVNGLVRLCTLALFNEEVWYAKTVLRSDGVGRWFELAVCHLHDDLHWRSSEQEGRELVIIKSLGEIAEQAHEMARAIMSCFEGGRCCASVWRVVHVRYGSLPLILPAGCSPRRRRTRFA
jgi:phosphate uptake regulator